MMFGWFHPSRAARAQLRHEAKSQPLDFYSDEILETENVPVALVTQPARYVTCAAELDALLRNGWRIMRRDDGFVLLSSVMRGKRGQRRLFQWMLLIDRDMARDYFRRWLGELDARAAEQKS